MASTRRRLRTPLKRAWSNNSANFGKRKNPVRSVIILRSNFKRGVDQLLGINFVFRFSSNARLRSKATGALLIQRTKAFPVTVEDSTGLLDPNY